MKLSGTRDGEVRACNKEWGPKYFYIRLNRKVKIFSRVFR